MRIDEGARSSPQDGMGRIAAWSGFTSVAAAPIMLCVNVAIARLCNSAEAGAAFASIAWAILIAQIVQVGLQVSGVRLASQILALEGRAQAVRLTTRVVHLVLFQSIAFAIASLSFAAMTSIPQMLLAVNNVVDVAAIVVLGSLQGARLCVCTMFRIFGDFRYSAFFGRLGPPFGGLVLIALVALARHPLTSSEILIPMIAAELVNLAASLRVYRNLSQRFSAIAAPAPEEQRPRAHVNSSARALYANGVALAINALTVNASFQVGVLIAAHLASPHDVAIVGLVIRLWALSTGVIVVFGQFASPQIARLCVPGHGQMLERTLRSAAAITGMFGTLAALAVIIADGWLFDLLFGTAYRAVAIPAAVIFSAHAIALYMGPARDALAMGGRPWISSIATAAGLLVSWVLGRLLYPGMGATGIAAAVAAGLIASQVSSAYYLKRVMGVRSWASPGDVVRLFRAGLRFIEARRRRKTGQAFSLLRTDDDGG